MKIKLLKIINIIGIGYISTILILLMIETLYAQILTDFIIGFISNNTVLLIIILGLFVLSMIISIMVGFYITGDINRNSVIKSSLMSLLCTLFFLFIVSNIFMFLNYKNVYSKISGFEILLIFPQILVYFGIYILNDVFNLFLFSISVYYVFFVIFLKLFYEVKYR